MADFWIYMVYGVPSVILYLLVFYVRIRDRNQKLSGAFNTIFFTSSVCDILSYLNSIFINKLPLSRIIEDFYQYTLCPYAVYLNYSHLAGIYSYYLEASFLFLMTVNRWSAVYLVTKYDRIWTGRNLFIAMIVVFAFPHFILFPYYGSTLKVPIINDTVVPTFGHNVAVIDFTVSMFKFGVLGICSIFNIATFVGLSSRLKSHTTKMRSAERNHVFLSAATFLIQLISASQSLGTSLIAKSTWMYTLIYTTLPFVKDFNSLSAPYLLIIFNSVIRSRLRRLFTCSNRHDGNMSTVNSDPPKFLKLKESVSVWRTSVQKF